MIEVLGPIPCKDLHTTLNTTTTSTSTSTKSSSKLSLSGNELLLILFHGNWNGYKKSSKDELFLNHLSNEIEKDNLKHIKSNSIFRLMHHHNIIGVVNDDNKIQIASTMITNDNNNDEDATLNFCIHELNVPSTLPTLALLFLSGKDEKGYVIKYIKIDSMSLHSCIIGIDSNFHKRSDRNVMELIVQGIKDALFECIDDNRKRKSITEGDGSGNIITNKIKKTKSTSNSTTSTPMEMDTDNTETHNKIKEQQIRIFISGDKSQVGKSSICLGLLGSFLKIGYKSSDLAYIKPATQCEKPTLVSKYCNANNISCQHIGPLVYFKGYTREFLSGNTHTSEELLDQIAKAVDDVGRDKKIVIIDGVGYPAVGSICGTDNATIASRCGISIGTTPNGNESSSKKRLPALVLIVGKSGVGDAVDSFNLNRTYFEHKNVPILGAIFNRFPLDGYYSMDNCQREITKYFSINNITRYHPFGFIPEIPSLVKLNEQESSNAAGTNTFHIEAANDFISTFQKHVNVEYILKEATNLTNQLMLLSMNKSSISRNDESNMEVETVDNNSTIHSYIPAKTITSSTKKIILTREQIEKVAKAAGAAKSA